MGARTRWLGCAALGVVLAGCQPGPGREACPLPGQTRVVSLKLYFGRDIPGGGFVDDAAWTDFAARILTPSFPDGFTVLEATGQWRNPVDGQVSREKSIVVEVVGPVSPPNVAAVVAAYRTRFKQVSVGQVSEDACAAF